MAKVPTKMRFEVFKRDSFKCQYCGKSAPDVVLHCDHILPQSKRGKNTLLNLITSCIDCNLGKSDKLLSDDSAVTKAKAQADTLQERRNQISMMADWYAELESQKDAEVDIVDQAISNYCNFRLSDKGRSAMKGRLRKYGLPLLIEKIQESFAKGAETPDAFDLCIDRLEKLLKWANKPIHVQKATYIAAVVRNKYPKHWGWHNAFRELLLAILEEYPDESDRFYRLAAGGGEIGDLRDLMIEHGVDLGMDEDRLNDLWNNAK